MKTSLTNTSKRYKIINPCRNQVEMQMTCLDDLLPMDHKARAVWDYVDKMDTNACLQEILSYRHEAGRPTTSPKVLLALWIYSILDGNVSARKIVELCSYHDAYKWIAGKTPINRTMVSDFRSNNVEKFNDLLTSCLAVMVQCEVLSDQDFSQDGTRVKANAGFSSFRGKDSLQKLKEEMLEHIKQLDLELLKNPQAYDECKLGAKKRAIRERSERIDQALANLEDCKKKR